MLFINANFLLVRVSVDCPEWGAGITPLYSLTNREKLLMTEEQAHELKLWEGIVAHCQQSIDECDEPQRIPNLLNHLADNKQRLEKFRSTLSEN